MKEELASNPISFLLVQMSHGRKTDYIHSRNIENDKVRLGI